MSFNIVLIEPEIPNNTGNIGRLSLASGCNLHLVKPFGFELSDKRVKRAGLDYWQHVNLHIYENIEEFFTIHNGKNMAYFTSKGNQYHWDLEYQKDMFLIFGKESKFKGFGMKILGFFAGVVGVYCSLFAIGNFIYSNIVLAFGLTAVAVVCGLVIIKSFQKTD